MTRAAFHVKTLSFVDTGWESMNPDWSNASFAALSLRRRGSMDEKGASFRSEGGGG